MNARLFIAFLFWASIAFIPVLTLIAINYALDGRLLKATMYVLFVCINIYSAWSMNQDRKP
jgi:uncharacterized membrane protein YqjE